MIRYELVLWSICSVWIKEPNKSKHLTIIVFLKFLLSYIVEIIQNLYVYII